MIDYTLLTAVVVGVAVLLILVLLVRIQAFLALLVTCIVVGVIAGMPGEAIIDSIKNGMGGTLGFVATVVGLGAIFGAILERSGSAQGLANTLLNRFGEKNAPWALVVAGFLIAIPVFLEVAFIILVPIVYALQRRTGKSLLLYGIPLLAGLAITHSFIPPTPGPIAVAEIVGADLGAVIIVGFMVGIPTAIIAGPLFGRYVAGKMHIEVPNEHVAVEVTGPIPAASTTISIIAIPIGLIVANTILNSSMGAAWAIPENIRSTIGLFAHPFTALILANLVAWYVLGVKRGYSRDDLLRVSTNSLTATGTIVLLTGAGGAFKQLLVDTGAGAMIAESLSSSGLSILIFAFIVTAIVRVLQGSATVAMITGGGLTAPLIDAQADSMEKALVVIAVASGATILSHVNDSGFWLVNRYLGLSEKQTLQTWTVMETIIALCGLTFCLILSLFL